MNWFGFHALSSAALFLLAVPLVLFYFLKLKRPRQDVPSLFLWRQVLNDSRVNSPFQRFKRNLLLLLQLLALMFLVLAAMQPFWRGRQTRVRRLPVLIDCSASMAALDREGGTSRLDEAKARVRKLIDQMPSDQELCLVAFSRVARRMTGFTTNRRLLRTSLDAIQVEDVPSNVEAPLRLAQALGRGTDFDEVLLLSDGNFPGKADFDLSFKIDYQCLDPGGPNLGITAFNATRTNDGDWSVYLGVEGSPEADASAGVEVTEGERAVAKDRIVITKGRPARITFTVPGGKAASLKATVTPEAFDSLASDNTAYLDLPVARPLWVYASPSLVSYRHALAALRTVRLYPEESGGSPPSRYDLVVADREEDLGYEARTRLTVGFVPRDLQGLVSTEKKASQVVDWRRSAPLLQHVELSGLVVLDRPITKEGVGPADFENLGYEALVDGPRGPLLLERRRGQELSYHLLFHTDRSTLPYRVGFPILVSNLVQAAMAQARLAGTQAAATGVLPPIPLQPDRVYSITGPGGEARHERSDRDGLLSGVPAPRVGRYRVAEGGADVATIGASLLSPSETSLAASDQIQFDEDLSVAASSRPLRADRSLWGLLAFVAFAVLLGEWWLFQRRPGGFRR